jgi:protein TonB
MSRGRISAIVIVALLHAVLGYAFVTGLAYSVIKNAAQDLKTFDVVEEPPPPEEEPPPPPDTPQPVQPPQIVSPPPIVRTQTNPPMVQVTRTAPPPQVTYTAAPAPPAPRVAPPPPPPPPPAAPVKAQDARAKANLASYVSNDDYPSSAIQREEQGTTRFRLTVGTDGRVTNCEVTGSSGSSALDSTTCRLMRSRARFTPARDSGGNPTTDSVSSSIRWVLPE